MADIARTVPELIAHKRDGGELSADEVRALVEGFTSGEVADYQMSALAMAIYWRGMTPRETAALTLAMRDSGRVVALDGPRGVHVDKHSTGGVGDKISLCLAPIVAACGVRVPMVSGRGLGHTGGTLDKLEAIPGFSVSMSVERFVAQVGELGCALIGQTADIAPADKKLYALRDVTATVESIPLITASILSKKLAEGIDGLVLDVKVGRGAFMKTHEDALALAHSIVRVGRLAKKRVSAVLTAMDAPLGRTIGNGLETAEAFAVLHGRGPTDVTLLTYTLGAEMLRLAGLADDEGTARGLLEHAVKSGAAAETMRKIVAAQGGDPRCVDEPDRLPRAPVIVDVLAEQTGTVQGIDALELGWSAVALGAGRTRADQDVDPAVGIVLQTVCGDRVDQGGVVAKVHARTRESGETIAARVAAAYRIGAKGPKMLPLVLDVIRD